MIEQKMRSGLLLLAGLVLASGAWGQTTIMTQTKGGSITVASEFFGSPDGREVLFILPDVGDFASPQTSQPYIVLTIADDPAQSGTGSLGTNNTTRVTYTLNGATFAGSAGGTNLRYFDGNTLGAGISVRVVDGGSRGSRSVTYEVETTADIPLSGGTKALYFFPPNLQVDPILLNPLETNPAAQVQGVTVVASIDGSNARVSSNPFPRGVLGSGTDRSTGAMVVNPLPDGEIVRLAPALSASLGPLGAVNEANVDIRNRTALADGLQVTMSNGQRTRGLKVGELSIALTPEASAPRTLRSLAVTNVGGNLDSALGGTADVTVTGPFQRGDMVILGENRTSDSSKAFRMAADGGPATVSVPIATMTAMNVVYVPGGTVDLRPGVFRASLALDFNDDNARDGIVGGSSGRVNYRGITTQAYAHGVSSATDTEVTSFLRLTCASVTPPATGCNVFLTCNGEDGGAHFGDLTGAAAISSGATGVYSSAQIASALGGGWSQGGGRCDIMSNGSLEVQHMIRTSGDALHNNSIVIGGTQTNSVGLLRGAGLHPLGSITLSLGSEGQLFRLADGRFYGTLPAIQNLRAQLMSNMGLPPGTRLNAPPSSSGGGFRPMDHEPGCAILELDRTTISQIDCIHTEAISTAPILMGSTNLMSGDVLYPTTSGNVVGAVFRPASGGIIAQPVPMATGTGFVLSG